MITAALVAMTSMEAIAGWALMLGGTGALTWLAWPAPGAFPSGVVVARDSDKSCERCEQAIRRGEAYVPPLAGIGLYEHVHCPDVDAETVATRG